jgi:prophage regulatory protein
MNEATRLLRLQQVIDRTGMSRSTLYTWVAQGRMPAPVCISDRTTGWVEQEIEDFVRSRIAAARTPSPKAGIAK